VIKTPLMKSFFLSSKAENDFALLKTVLADILAKQSDL
jgi:hypothetical protein